MNQTRISNTHSNDQGDNTFVQLVSSENTNTRFSTELIAIFSNKVILLAMPDVAQASYLITRGKKFQVRFAVDNITYTFNTHVIRVCQQPYVCLRVSNQDKLMLDHEIFHALSA